MRTITLTILLCVVIFSAFAQAGLEKAKVLAEQGKFKEAIAVIDQLIGADPYHATYFHEKANYLLSLQAYEDIVKTLSEGTRLMPDSVSLYDMRGTLLERFGLFNEAIEDFTSGYEKSNTPVLKSHMLANRGGMKARIQDFESSYSDLILAIKFDSTNVDALNNLAAVCDEVNRPDETFKYLRQIIRLNPNYTGAYVNMGFKYQVMNKHDEAIRYFDKAIALDPNEALAYSNRSFSKYKLKKLDDAMKDIDHSISLLPGNSYAYKIRALIKIEKGSRKEACTDLNQALTLGYTNQYGKEVEELLAKNCKN